MMAEADLAKLTHRQREVLTVLAHRLSIDTAALLQAYATAQELPLGVVAGMRAMAERSVEQAKLAFNGVAERCFKGAGVGSRPTRRDNQRESDFEFLIVCIVLTAMIFGAIHAVAYFTDSSRAAGGISAESAIAPKRNP